LRIEAFLTPSELTGLAGRNLREKVCVVFDVLRATSTFATALNNGAAGIIPVGEISEALELKKQRPDVLLGGERNGLKIHVNGRDFDFGNSPREYAPEKVRGRTIVSATTNGTRAVRACMGAGTVIASSFLNLSATSNFLLERKFESVLLVCAGTGERAALEDILAAGALCATLAPHGTAPATTSQSHASTTLSDSAQLALAAFKQGQADLSGTIFNSENARRLLGIPELREDVEFCLRRDVYEFVAALKEGAIRSVG